MESLGTSVQGWLFAVTDKASDAIQAINTGITALRSTGARLWMPLSLTYLTKAYAKLGQFDDAWRSIEEALSFVETIKEKWSEAEVYRVAGEIALISPDRAAAKGEAYFQRALAVARFQQAKSWELRAAMSLARLWRDQGKRDEARELLAPVYGWFTEGFDGSAAVENVGAGYYTLADASPAGAIRRPIAPTCSIGASPTWGSPRPMRRARSKRCSGH
jgi:predicted ATPase